MDEAAERKVEILCPYLKGCQADVLRGRAPHPTDLGIEA